MPKKTTAARAAATATGGKASHCATAIAAKAQTKTPAYTRSFRPKRTASPMALPTPMSSRAQACAPRASRSTPYAGSTVLMLAPTATVNQPR